MKQAFEPMRNRHVNMETRLTSGPGMRPGTGGVGSGPRRPAPVTAGAVTHHTGSYVRARDPLNTSNRIYMQI